MEVGTRLTLTVNVTEFNRDIDSIMWTLNGMVIKNGVDGYTLTNISLEAPPSMVSLTRDSVISPAEDSGNYTVSVTNAAGPDTSKFNVTVTGESIDVTKLRKCSHHVVIIVFSLLTDCLSVCPPPPPPPPPNLSLCSQLVQASLLPQ